MNLRPITEELCNECMKHKYCDNCPIRIGCQLRYNFYVGDSIHELALQMAEYISVHKNNVPEQFAFEIANHIRCKREHEVITKPRFSYI